MGDSHLPDSGKHHAIITGVGRSGTTLLVKICTRLGLDTGFKEDELNIDAGLEKSLLEPDAPYLVKSPWICDYLGDFLQQNQAVIDYAIIPMRDLYEAAKSRRVNSRKSPNMHPQAVAGGLCGTNVFEAQEVVLACKRYNLMLVLAKNQIPTILLDSDRLGDPHYLYRTLKPILGAATQEEFSKAHRQFYRPELRHNYKMRNQENPARS